MVSDTVVGEFTIDIADVETGLATLVRGDDFVLFFDGWESRLSGIPQGARIGAADEPLWQLSRRRGHGKFSLNVEEASDKEKDLCDSRRCSV